ncbi:hypothetical protein Tco_0318564 [Tanacetum coccineum]
MLRAFPMFLTGAINHWLRNKPTCSITTWDGLKTKFLNKYCPPTRTTKKMEEINNFQQEPNENLYQAWEQFKELLIKCPQHYLTEMQEVILFYNGLGIPTRHILDSRGAISSKTVADAKVAIQEMAEYSQKWHNETSTSRSTKTSDGLAAIQAQLNNLGREIKKVNEKVYVAQVGCEQCKGPHYTKYCPLKEKGKTLEEAYYTQFGGPFQGGGYRAAALGFYQRNNANPSYQEQRQSMKDTLSKFMSESAKRHKENSNLIKEIQASTNAAIRNQGASIKTLEIQIGQMSKVLQERGFGSLPRSTEANPRDQVKSISTTIEDDSYPIRQKKGSYGPQFSEAYSEASHINNSLPRKEKDLGSFTLPCFINNVCFDNALVDLGASISVMPLLTYLNLELGELAHTKLTVELADRTVKYLKGIAKSVLVGFGKFVFPVDFIILDIPEDIKVPLILGRPFLSTARAKIDVYKRNITLRVGEKGLFSQVILDPFLEDYIELNDLNEPFELRINQGDDLMPTIEEGKVIEEFRTRDDEFDIGIDDYPRALMNVPIFVGTFSVVTDFVVLENMDAYRDEGMGDVIFGEPFLREVGIKIKRFEGIITIYNGDDDVTYQMVRSHPRFKHHTNEQCNKIPPLLKVSEKDEMNRISYAY